MGIELDILYFRLTAFTLYLTSVSFTLYFEWLAMGNHHHFFYYTKKAAIIARNI